MIFNDREVIWSSNRLPLLGDIDELVKSIKFMVSKSSDNIAQIRTF